MPERLARDLILSYSDPGDTVLDPIGGVATTAKMALLHYRRFISIEPDRRYHDLAERRIREATERLFLEL
jgi:DNA modification methylase